MAYLKPSQIYTFEPFFKNSQRLLTVNYFRKKAPSQMFDLVENTLQAYEILETEVSEKSNTTGGDSFIVQFDQNFVRNF